MKAVFPNRPFPERNCMTDLKVSRAQMRLEKAAREGGNAGLHYEVEARAIREKIARLRALRIAKEAGEKSARLGEDVAGRKSVTKSKRSPG
jgi:hypothetical protein